MMTKAAKWGDCPDCTGVTLLHGTAKDGCWLYECEVCGKRLHTEKQPDEEDPDA